MRDVAHARTQIEHLLGEITLHPKDGYLEAKLGGDFAGLLKLAEINVMRRKRFAPPTCCLKVKLSKSIAYLPAVAKLLY